ncbi:MAG TPA: hypothetical protein VN578_08415 [Candidatus Binatia bacterium]|jgi:hypothetical protein|nr:hypothetical protein [Candidatus Binatia bacterium]
MKTLLRILTLACVATIPASAQQAQTATTAAPDTSAYTVVEQGPHHKVWQRTEWESGLAGQRIPHVHSYTELATGMSHLVGNQWVDSSPEIQVTSTGAQATNAQHQVSFLGNINTSGAVDTTTPEGKHLVSNILGLSYFDTATSNSAIIASIKDSSGQLLPTKDRAWFPDAFTGLSADVLYVNSIICFEQLVVLTTQLPSPTKWNMDPSTVLVQLTTEFINPPSPQIALLQENGVTDQHIDFGAMKMGPGYAFALGSEENKVKISKQWLVQDGRTFLIESVRFPDLLPLMQDLPPPPPGTARLSAPPGSVLHQLASHRRLLLPKLAATATTRSPFRISNATLSKGLALDYSLLNSQTNLLAKSDTTYYVSGSVLLSGSNVFEGGTVIKYTNNASITVEPIFTTPTVSFLGSAYRPIVFTARDDNSVGETISGSTGSPAGYYANPALLLVVSPTVPGLSSVRFAYAKQAVELSGSSSLISDAQFVNCQQGVNASNSTVNLRNVLFANTATNIAVPTGGVTATAENVTFSGTAYLATGPSSANATSVTLTNCILANVTNLFAGVLTTNADYNAFYQSPSFGTHIAPSVSSSPFQTVGAGSFYLAADSPYRNYGTTNISGPLLADLQKKTTYPPILYSNAAISSSNTFVPQAQRDTDIPDLGYHYDPLDYIFGGCDANTNLTFAPGTAVGWWRTSQGWTHAGHGIHIADGQAVTFSGTASAPCYWVRRSTVQEGIPGLSEGLYGPGGITGWTWPNFTQAPNLWMRFTRLSCLADDATHIRDDNGYLIVHARDCEFWSGSLGGYASQLNYTNCLFDRANLWTSWDGQPTTNCTLTIRNAAWHAGNLGPTRGSAGPWPQWTILDTAFDSTSTNFNDAASGNTNYTRFDYNAFLFGQPRLTPAGPHDVLVTNTFNWQSSWLGNYYQPTNSPLIDKGSVTADLIGLYHFTTQTNQMKETNSIVDISYHYVAVDTNGVPISTPGDGIPDYLADANGNGLVDPGEISWTNYYSPNGLTNGSGLQVFTPLK